jgi:predicted alpha/beta superfamily hydrolase
MRKVIFSILIALAPLSAAAQTALLPLEVKSEPEVVELRFAKENMVKSQATERNYRIQTALFGPEPESGYPVLFVLDGDAYFSTVASFAQGLANSPAKDTTMSLLIVGVGYSADNLLDIKQRSLDYTPPLREDATDEERSKYGQGDRFYQFLNQELMDYLATQYTLDLSQLAIYGHSFGALYGLYELLHKDSQFTYFVLSSPSIWWHDKRILDFVDGWQQAQNKYVRITVGELEAVAARHDTRRRSRDMTGHAENLYQQLKAEAVEAEFAIYPDESHGTVAYKSVLDSLKFLQSKLR